MSASAGRTMLVAQRIMEQFLATKAGEKVLIGCDTEADIDFALALADASTRLGAEPSVMIVPPAFDVSDRRPPEALYKAMETVDIYIPMVTRSLHMVHSVEISRLHAAKKIRKMVLMDVWRGTQLNVIGEAVVKHDYNRVFELGTKLAAIMSNAEHVRVTSKQGSDFTAKIKPVVFRVSSGYATKPGMYGALPAGEAFGGPAEGTTEGTIVIDGAITFISHEPVLAEPVRVTVKKGRVTKIEGGSDADRLRQMIESNENGDNIAELSMGVNPYTRPIGDSLLNDKTVLGTMHVAFGDNVHQIFPHGTIYSPIHSDALMLKPSFWVDGKQILEDGKLKVQL